jgi:hypothetical protein
VIAVKTLGEDVRSRSFASTIPANLYTLSSMVLNTDRGTRGN